MDCSVQLIEVVRRDRLEHLAAHEGALDYANYTASTCGSLGCTLLNV